MSYFAQGIMDANDLEGKGARMTEEQNARDMAELYKPPAAKPVTAPAEDPRSFGYDAPAGAEDPNTAIGKERQRFAGAGMSQNETYRLLGGARQRLGG